MAQGIFPAIGDYFNHNQELLPGPGYEHGFFYNLVESSQPVSYTHLDVYKRQICERSVIVIVFMYV